MANNEAASGVANLAPVWQAQQQRVWRWYDWANSAYVTTVTTVLFAPYLIAVAKDAAVDNRVNLLGLSVAPGALPSFIITASTFIGALTLPFLGAWADRVTNKKAVLAGFAWAGAAFASLLWFCRDGNWQIGAFAVFMANLCLAASLVINDAILPLIAEEQDLDRVSSRGWAWGYLGGGLLLAANLVVVVVLPFGLDQGLAARLCMLSAAIWWAGFTLIPFLKLRNYTPADKVHPEETGVISGTIAQLTDTIKDIRNYPVALTFLVAYLFFNDGIQTVIASASTYGAEELKFGQSILIATILLVQFVAFGGALLFGRLAERRGTKNTILIGLLVWMVIVTVALFLPEKQVVPFLVLAVAIGIVLGGTQALARSYFALFIPPGKEAEYFSFYHLMDRGTSWFGTAVFGVVYQLTDSYRPAIFALIFFFAVGGLILLRVDTQKGIEQAKRSIL